MITRHMVSRRGWSSQTTTSAPPGVPGVSIPLRRLVQFPSMTHPCECAAWNARILAWASSRSRNVQCSFQNTASNSRCATSSWCATFVPASFFPPRTRQQSRYGAGECGRHCAGHSKKSRRVPSCFSSVKQRWVAVVHSAVKHGSIDVVGPNPTVMATVSVSTVGYGRHSRHSGPCSATVGVVTSQSVGRVSSVGSGHLRTSRWYTPPERERRPQAGW